MRREAVRRETEIKLEGQKKKKRGSERN